MSEQLKIVIGADNKEAVASLQVMTNKLKEFERDLRKATDVQTAIKLNDQISNLKSSIASASQQLNNASNVVAKSKTNYTEFSRVIQDLPFGFGAISNNLTQLVPAAGAAGLAFSALVAAFTFAQTGLQNWTRGTNGATKAQKEFNDEIDKTKASALTTGIQLQGFVDIAKNGNLPLAQRNEALRKANELIGEHGQKLTLVNVATAETTKFVKQLTDGLIAQAVAAKFADKIAELQIQRVATAKKLVQDKLTLDQQVKKSQSEEINLNTGLTKSSGAVTASFAAVDKSRKAYVNTINELNTLQADFNKALSNSTSLLGGIKTQTDGNTTSQKNYNTEVSKSVQLLTAFEQARLKAGSLKQAQTVITNEAQPNNTVGGNAVPLQNFLKILQDSPIEKAKLQVDQLSASFSTLLAPAIDTAFVSLANGENVGQALANSFKQMAVQLAAAAAKALILGAIINSIPGLKEAFQVTGGIGKLFGGFSGQKNVGFGFPGFATAGATGGNSVNFEISGSNLVGVLTNANRSLRYRR